MFLFTSLTLHFSNSPGTPPYHHPHNSGRAEPALRDEPLISAMFLFLPFFFATRRRRRAPVVSAARSLSAEAANAHTGGGGRTSVRNRIYSTSARG